MDPLSHIVCSRTLLALGNGPLRHGMAAAAMAGALTPDLDAVFMPAGWDIYLRVHEIGTHTLVGGLVAAGVVAAVIRPFSRDAPFRQLAVAAAIGTLSHIALDAVSGARLRLFWPALEVKTAIPLVAMGDPWLVAMFLGGAIGLAVARRHARFTAVIVMGMVCAFLALKAMALAAATPAWRNGPGQADITTSIVEARWGSLTEWHVFDRTPVVLRKWRVTVRSQVPVLLLAWPVARDAPLVERSRSLPTVQNFLQVHELAFAVERPEASGDTHVLWSDLRFCRAAGPEEAFTYSASVVTTSHEADDIACDVWVGGRFGGDGTPLTQIAQVGGWQRTRSVAR